MRLRSRLLALVVGSLLTGCVQPRPEGSVRVVTPSATAPMVAPATLGQQLQAAMQRKAAAVPRVAPERAMEDLPSRDEGRLDLLLLAGDALDGGFTAGFLRGWSSQTGAARARPAAFDIVAGLGSGALLVTQAFLGEAENDRLLTEAGFGRPGEAPLGEPSLARGVFSAALVDAAPLRQRLEQLITPALLDRVAAAAAHDPLTDAPARFLLVLAMNLDRGTPRILDLGAIARAKTEPARVERYIDALMAAAARPVLFPPVFIDGEMHADGGLRLASFFTRYLEAQRAEIDSLDVVPPRLDLVLDQEVRPAPACTENSLQGIGERTAEVVLDPLAFDSLYRLIGEAERQGFAMRYVTAADSGCPSGADRSVPSGSACRFEHARALASGATDPWRRGLAEVPGLDPAEATRPVVCPTG